MAIPNKNDLLKEFQSKIDYKFNNETLLEEALTTKNYGYQYHVKYFDGLDLLGDSLIKFIIVSKCVKKGLRERKRIHDIVEKYKGNFILSRIAKQFFDLDRYIIKFRDEKIIDTNIMADVLEAICGVIFLDSNGDYKIVEEKILNKFLGKLEELKF